MKAFASLAVLLLFLGLNGFGQDKIFTFKGQVYADGKTLKGALIEVYDAGDLVHESLTKGGGKFQFELKAERDYMVEVSMENMRMKTIWIKTTGTQKLNFKIPVFAFDVYLKEEKITLYDELSEIPVTLIKYNPKKKVYYMDKTYSNAVKKKKKEIKENSFLKDR